MPSVDWTKEDVMTNVRRLSLLGAAALFVGLGSVAGTESAQGGGQGSKMYDAKTERTIMGSVESVENITGTGGRGRSGMGGTHLVLKTDKDSVTFTWAPLRILPRSRSRLRKGIGSRLSGRR
jgi:hypothetical protein